MADSFFTQSNCDRCNSDNMQTRICSWFTEETICMVCSNKEQIVKLRLRNKGISNAMEGCGFIPNPDDY